MNAKVLVIEDDPDILMALLSLLESEGLQVIGANNGLIGLQLANQHIPNLIVSDINMPELNGYGVLSALRQNPKTARIPFIFLTGQVDCVERRRGVELGADAYLTKPVLPEELIQAIAIQLKRRRGSG